MATRVIPPRILRKVQHYNTATTHVHYPPSSLSIPLSPSCLIDHNKPPSSATKLLPPVADPSGGLNFHDVKKLFSCVSTTKLLRSTAVLHATALEPMVDLGTWIMRSKLMQMEAFRDITNAAIRASFYDHFCAGEDATTAGKSIAALNDAGLRGMLVYSVEDAHDNDACDRNLQGFLHTVDVSRLLPPSSVTASSFNIFLP